MSVAPGRIANPDNSTTSSRLLSPCRETPCPGQAPRPAPASRLGHTFHAPTSKPALRTPLLPGLSASASAIALGELHTCALLAGGGVMCWGRNGYGQLGISDKTDQKSPVTVPGARGYIYIYIWRNNLCMYRATIERVN